MPLPPLTYLECAEKINTSEHAPRRVYGDVWISGNVAAEAYHYYFDRIIDVRGLLEQDEDGFVSNNILMALSTIIDAYRKNDYKVLVHCSAGIERAPLVVAYYMVMKCKLGDFESAYNTIRLNKPDVHDRTHWVKWKWQQTLEEYGGNE